MSKAEETVFQREVHNAAQRIAERRGDYLSDLDWLVELALEAEFGK